MWDDIIWQLVCPTQKVFKAFPNNWLRLKCLWISRWLVSPFADLTIGLSECCQHWSLRYIFTERRLPRIMEWYLSYFLLLTATPGYFSLLRECRFTVVRCSHVSVLASRKLDDQPGRLVLSWPRLCHHSTARAVHGLCTGNFSFSFLFCFMCITFTILYLVFVLCVRFCNK